VSKTAHEIMHFIVPVIPQNYKPPADQKTADRDRARFLYEQHRDLMRKRGLESAEQLVQKYWTDPHGQLPLIPHEA
jgi:hypothetical protein